MAKVKIDTSKISGYSEMSIDDKLKALESYEYDDNLSEVERYKNAVTKTSSEVSEWKKKYNELAGIEEKTKTEAEQQLTAMQQQLEEFKKEKTLLDTKTKFLSLGYDEKLASETAQAFVDGEMDKVFENQKLFLNLKEQSMKADILKNTPTPQSGMGTQGNDYQKLIEDATINGDFASVAYYTRLSNQSTI